MMSERGGTYRFSILCLFAIVWLAGQNVGCRRNSATPTVSTAMALPPTVVLQEPIGLGTRLHANVFSTFSADGTRIVSIFPHLSADHEGDLVVWDAISGDIVTQWSLPRSNVGIDMLAALSSSADARVVGYHKKAGFVALDTRAKRELLRLPVNVGSTSAFAISPDGTLLATNVDALPEGIAIMDLATGERVATLDAIEPLGEGVTNLQFSPDNKTLIAHPMQVWDLTQNKRIARLWGHLEPTNQAVFSADGSRMVSTGKHCDDLRVWDTENWQEIQCLWQSHDAWRAGGLAFTKDSKFLWSRNDGKSATLWNLQTGKPERQVQLSLPKMPTQQTEDMSDQELIFSPIGELAIRRYGFGESASLWPSAAVYDLDKAVALAKTNAPLSEQTSPAIPLLVASIGLQSGQRSLKASPNGKQAVVFDYRAALLFNPADGSQRKTLEFPEGVAELGSSIAWTPDGATVSAIGNDAFNRSSHPLAKAIFHWNVASGESTTLAPELPVEPVDANVPTCLCYAPDGKQLAIGNKAGQVHLVDPITGAVKSSFSGPHQRLYHVAFMPDGESIVGIGSEVVYWSLATGEVTHRHPLPPSHLQPNPPMQDRMVAISPETGLGVTVGDREYKFIWELRTGKVVDVCTELAFHSANGAAFSPDGSFLAVWETKHPQVYVYDIHTRKLHTTIDVPKRYHSYPQIYDVMFSADNQTLITTDAYALRIWENRSGDE